jgi:hypothetical protein
MESTIIKDIVVFAVKKNMHFTNDGENKELFG